MRAVWEHYKLILHHQKLEVPLDAEELNIVVSKGYIYYCLKLEAA